MLNAKDKAVEFDRKPLDDHSVESTHQVGYTKIKVKSTFGSQGSIADMLYHTVLKKLQAT